MTRQQIAESNRLGAEIEAIRLREEFTDEDIQIASDNMDRIMEIFHESSIQDDVNMNRIRRMIRKLFPDGPPKR